MKVIEPHYKDVGVKENKKTPKYESCNRIPVSTLVYFLLVSLLSTYFENVVVILLNMQEFSVFFHLTFNHEHFYWCYVPFITVVFNDYMVSFSEKKIT